MTQKTVMQELIATIERKINLLKDIRYKTSDPLEVVRLSGKIDGLEIILSDCKYELPKERQQIIDALDKGRNMPIQESGRTNGENYYNQTYGGNK